VSPTIRGAAVILLNSPKCLKSRGGRLKNVELRSREHLTPDEVERMVAAARQLVMIEALACGTPVIARPCGSVPEVLKDGISGFIASEVDGLVEAVRKLGDLPRQFVRQEFESRFTGALMAAHYEELYYDLIENVHESSAAQQPRLYMKTPVPSNGSAIADTADAVNDLSGVGDGGS
jgi:glycosyltransferase involved in cell wall biosynthesis